MTFRFPIICVVTSGIGTSPALVREAAAAGIDVVQIREPRLESRALATLVREAIGAAAGSSCRVLVNDRTDVAIAADAAGVHLRGDSVRSSRVREIAPSPFIIGRSVHSAEEAAAVTREGGCDYLMFGTVFQSKSKPTGHPVAGLHQLQKVCRSTDLPVLAVGGISIENAADTIAAGARGIAAIDLFSRPGTIGDTVARLRREFDSSSEVV